MIAIIVVSQIILVPILGGIWLGMRNERLHNKRQLSLAIENLHRQRFRR